MQDYQIAIIAILALILVILIVSYVVYLYRVYKSKRYFKLAYFYQGKKIKEEICKVNTLVEPLKDCGLKEVEIEKVVSLSNLKGKVDKFSFPASDVKVYFKDIEKEEVKVETRVYEVPDKIRAYEDKVRPVLLLNVEDVIRHIYKTNLSPKLFPLYNSYLKKTTDSDRTYLVLKAGGLIYSIVFYSDITFKIYAMVDSSYVKEHLTKYSTLEWAFNDIYSVIVNYEFKTFDEVYEILDRAYSYALSGNYVLENNRYVMQESKLEKMNADFLSLDEALAEIYDPLFDLAYKEAQTYLEEVNKKKELEEKLDREFVTEKEKVLSKLESGEEYLKYDEYLLSELDKNPLSYSLVGKTSAEIKVELEDIEPVRASMISISALLDYLESISEEENIKINVSSDMSRYPTYIYSESEEPIAMFYKLERSYRLNIRLSSRYLEQEVLVIHPRSKKIGIDESSDWYNLVLDDTYISYEELSNLILDSRDYCLNKR